MTRERSQPAVLHQSSGWPLVIRSWENMIRIGRSQRREGLVVNWAASTPLLALPAVHVAALKLGKSHAVHGPAPTKGGVTIVQSRPPAQSDSLPGLKAQRSPARAASCALPADPRTCQAATQSNLLALLERNDGSMCILACMTLGIIPRNYCSLNENGHLKRVPLKALHLTYAMQGSPMI